MTNDSLVLYGVPFSQPVRAVMWLLLYKQYPFEMVLINPGSKGDTGSRNPTFLAKNPSGTIPTIEEPATGFTLGEAHAIMAYLCNTHNWSDLYPTFAQDRARIDWYLNFHHRNVRDASVGLVAPKIRKDLAIPEAVQQSARATVSAAFRTLDNGCLAQTEFLAGENLTIADFAAYVEIGQLQPEFTNVFEFSPYPNLCRWLERMKAVAGHDVVHTVLTELGDISEVSPSMELIKTSNKKALQALKSRLDEFA